MTPSQGRAARALLDWSQRRLADESKVHHNTISNFEKGKYFGKPETVAAIKSALEASGIKFVENGVVKNTR